MVAGLPGKGATSLDAPLCAVTAVLGDAAVEIFLNKLICDRLLSSGFFPQ